MKKNILRNGSTLLVTVLMLGFGGLVVGSLFMTNISLAKNGEQAYFHDRAAFLADAGIHAAVVKLNASDDAAIGFEESRSYFARPEAFPQSDWGFSTRLAVTNGRHHLFSTGRYGGNRVTVECDVTPGAGGSAIHALYAHALFAGNASRTPSYILKIGGTGTGADFVRGDTYSGGKIDVSGEARLRHPEILVDRDGDGLCSARESWTNAYAVRTFTNGLTQKEFEDYRQASSATLGKTYNNNRYDAGEAFHDSIGNGQYDPGEPFTDLNGNGVRDPGDAYLDRNGNGSYDATVDGVVNTPDGRWNPGESWTEDGSRSQRVNGRHDPAGGYWRYASGTWSWRTSYTSFYRTYSCSSWPAEAFDDIGNGTYNPEGEPYEDGNGIYDPGEAFVDDRNSLYDYGTHARGSISGMPPPGPGQRATAGYDASIDPPNLTNMYYRLHRDGPRPADALARWGHDVAVTASDYGSARAISDPARPEHIFIRNPPASGSVTSGGRTIYGRDYAVVTNGAGRRLDDYFLEDPADPSYNTYVEAESLDGTAFTAPMYLNVTPEGNNKLYYVDGNVYLHNPRVYSLRFREPGTRITIVANGNITISDEFYYHGSYPAGLTRSTLSSAVVRDPLDALCLIALKNPDFPGLTGNIFIGDAQFGTGGSIHALLYAENDFVDNNLNTSDQAFLSVFGNMTAGNHVRLNRTGTKRTRLDISLDERIRDGEALVPGLPHPMGEQRRIRTKEDWRLAPGTWTSPSYLQ